MLSVGNGPGFGPLPPLPLPNGMQGPSSNHSQMFPTSTNTMFHTLPNAKLLPPLYSSQSVNQPMPQIYRSQPFNLSYFPPNQEQSLNTRRPSIAPAPQQPYTTHQTSRMTSTSEDEEDSPHMAQEIPWQTVKGNKRGEKNTHTELV